MLTEDTIAAGMVDYPVVYEKAQPGMELIKFENRWIIYDPTNDVVVDSIRFQTVTMT
ncbi:MAG: hypothetical protein ABIH41_02785 [Nanoarchaeota archaeon]